MLNLTPTQTLPLKGEGKRGVGTYQGVSGPQGYPFYLYCLPDTVKVSQH